MSKKIEKVNMDEGFVKANLGARESSKLFHEAFCTFVEGINLVRFPDEYKALVMSYGNVIPMFVDTHGEPSAFLQFESLETGAVSADFFYTVEEVNNFISNKEDGVTEFEYIDDSFSFPLRWKRKKNSLLAFLDSCVDDPRCRPEQKMEAALAKESFSVFCHKTESGFWKVLFNEEEYDSYIKWEADEKAKKEADSGKAEEKKEVSIEQSSSDEQKEVRI